MCFHYLAGVDASSGVDAGAHHGVGVEAGAVGGSAGGITDDGLGGLLQGAGGGATLRQEAKDK